MYKYLTDSRLVGLPQDKLWGESLVCRFFLKGKNHSWHANYSHLVCVALFCARLDSDGYDKYMFGHIHIFEPSEMHRKQYLGTSTYTFIH